MALFTLWTRRIDRTLYTWCTKYNKEKEKVTIINLRKRAPKHWSCKGWGRRIMEKPRSHARGICSSCLFLFLLLLFSKDPKEKRPFGTFDAKSARDPALRRRLFFPWKCDQLLVRPLWKLCRASRFCYDAFLLGLGQRTYQTSSQTASTLEHCLWLQWLWPFKLEINKC